ncbi:MAG: sel1 repeat family protein [Myxococcales bacterium]|nr:sel1 repeat family protein [Myxococcales bacterium]
MRRGLLLWTTFVAACSGSAASTSSSSSASAATAQKPEAPPEPAVDVPAAIAACKKGKEAACKTGCEAKDLPSCLMQGQLALASKDREEKAACRVPLTKACDGNLGRACSDLASRCSGILELAGGKALPASEELKLNQKACELGDGQGCLQVAKRLEQGTGAPKDPAKSAELYKKALEILPKECDAGDARSCLLLASELDPEIKSKHPKDPKRAGELYKKACDGGEAMGCAGMKRLVK